MKTAELFIFCEGPTESDFVTKVLRPHLSAYRVYPEARPLCNSLYGIVPFEKLRKAVKNQVGNLRPHQFVTTMVDLYGLTGFPHADNVLPGESVYDRVARIEEGMRAAFGNPQVLPYIQVHEFEALVFVDLDQLPAQFPDGDANDAPLKLRQSIGESKPEMIDDGAETAPSKRLLKVIPSYNKRLHGPEIAKAIGVDRLRAACPHFDNWLSRLEDLAEK